MEQREQLLNLHRIRSVKGGCRLVGRQDESFELPWLTGGIVWEKILKNSQDANIKVLQRDRNIQLHETEWG